MFLILEIGLANSIWNYVNTHVNAVISMLIKATAPTEHSIGGVIVPTTQRHRYSNYSQNAAHNVNY